MDASPADHAPWAQLRTLLAALPGQNAFYTPRLVGVQVQSLAEFSARVPFTTKAEVVADHAAHPPFGTNLTEPLARYTRFCQTSGTTAQPLAILDTPESWQWMLGNWQHIYEAAQVRAGQRVYFAFSFGPFLGFWTAFEAAVQRGCLALPGGGLSSLARLQAMQAYGAEVLCGTPTYALHLGEAARAAGLALPVRTIIVAGEPGGSVPAVRARLAELWPGATVLDHYGMTEVGPAAYQRPGEPEHLRIIERSYYAEVVHPQTGVPVPPGTVGELVLTTLGRTACPLLRYRTGDLVERDAAQPGFALRGGVLGRADDMVVVRGVNIYPAAVEAVVRGIPAVAEYRVAVSRRGPLAELALEVEVAEETAVAALQTALTGAFALRIPVRRVAAGTLPRFEMKARRWVWRDMV